MSEAAGNSGKRTLSMLEKRKSSNVGEESKKIEEIAEDCALVENADVHYFLCNLFDEFEINFDPFALGGQWVIWLKNQFFPGSMKYRSGSRVGDSGSFFKNFVA